MKSTTIKRRKHPQTSSERKIWLYLLFTIVAVIVLMFFLSGPRGTIQLIRQNKEKERLLKEIEELEKTKVALDSEKVKLKQDAYIEKIAREQYNMKKEGEKVYKIEIEDKDKK